MINNGNDVTDETLARQAAAGKHQAFSLLVKRYSGRVYNVAYRFSGNRADAEDIVQEVFIKVFRGLPKAHLDLPFRPWLYRIATNTAISHLRAKPAPALPEEAAKSVPTEKELPEESADRAELGARLQQEILKLPLNFREVVILRYTEELTFREIGTILEIPENTVKTYFQRAKIILRKELGDLFETK